MIAIFSLTNAIIKETPCKVGISKVLTTLQRRLCSEPSLLTEEPEFSNASPRR